MTALKRILFSRLYFQLAFFFYVYTNTLALGYLGIENNPLWLPVAAWALLLLVYESRRHMLFYRGNHLLIIALYGIALLLATLHNSPFSSLKSYTIALMQLIVFVFIFSMRKHTTLEELKKEYRTIIPFTSVLTLISGSLSLLFYLFNIYDYANGWPIGLVGDRLFGVYFNCNPAAFLSCIMLILSIIALTNKYPHRRLYLANLVVQLLYILLTKCRTAMIILLVLLVAMLYYQLFRKKAYSRLKKAGISLVACLLLTFGAMAAQEVISIIPRLQGAPVQQESRFQLAKLEHVFSLLSEGTTQSYEKAVYLLDEVSSGRIRLLRDSISIWQTNPLYGIGAGNFRTVSLSLKNQTALYGSQIVHAHNIFIEALVSAGVSGLILFSLFFLQSVFRIRDVLKKYRCRSSYLIILLLALAVGSEVIGGMFDYGVFYVYSLSAALAWWCLGRLYWFSEHPRCILIKCSNTWEIIDVQLKEISYRRQEGTEKGMLDIQLLDRKQEKDRCCIKADLQYHTSSNTSHFIYEGKMQLTGNSVKAEEEQQEMLKELRLLIEEDIREIMEKQGENFSQN